MSNVISNVWAPRPEFLTMSNDLTSVFINTICLAGADIAEMDFQKDLLIWFAQRDQEVTGLGCVGFDVSQIIWRKDIFQQQKKFIINTLDRAASKTNWHLLDYQPNEDRLIDQLISFRKMIESMDETQIESTDQIDLTPFDQHYEKCQRHQVFLHALGCVICNNN